VSIAIPRWRRRGEPRPTGSDGQLQGPARQAGRTRCGGCKPWRSMGRWRTMRWRRRWVVVGYTGDVARTCDRAAAPVLRVGGAPASRSLRDGHRFTMRNALPTSRNRMRFTTAPPVAGDLRRWAGCDECSVCTRAGLGESGNLRTIVRGAPKSNAEDYLGDVLQTGRTESSCVTDRGSLCS
jgi:hypothetical protein